MKPPKSSKLHQLALATLGEMEFHFESFKRLNSEASALRERAKILETEADAHMVFFGRATRRLQPLVASLPQKGGEA